MYKSRGAFYGGIISKFSLSAVRSLSLSLSLCFYELRDMNLDISDRKLCFTGLIINGGKKVQRQKYTP